MKNTTMQRLLSGALAVMLVTSLSTGAVAHAANFSVDEEVLLEAAQPVIDAHKKYYVLENINAADIHETAREDGGSYIEFNLNFDATLKYDSATEIPRIRGVAEVLNIEQGQSVDNFIADVRSAAVVNEVAAHTQEQISSINATVSTRASLANEVTTDLVAEVALDRLESYIAEIESEYIGKSYEHNIGLRANIDAQGNLIELEYETFDGYSKDISVAIPDSEESMMQEGTVMVNELVDATLSDAVAQGLDTMAVSPASNTGFVYYRTNARDYANRWTSNASTTTCTNKDCSNYGGKIMQTIGFYNNYEYSYYCCNDCANYVSQAMASGGVPTDSSWQAGKVSWTSCLNLKNYFYNVKKYWSTATYKTCNAGGIILLYKNDYKPFHAMMTVLNDGVKTQYSAHTHDRKMKDYTTSSLLKDGVIKVEYYIFDNVSPAH